MKLHPKQIEAVVALSGPERYSHFIKQTADSKEVWGLYKDGWAMAATDDGEPVFPLWPAEEYAAMSARNEWAGYESSSIALEDLIGELLPMLERDGVLPGIFFTPAEKGVTPKVSRLLEDLHHELSRYE